MATVKNTNLVHKTVELVKLLHQQACNYDEPLNAQVYMESLDNGFLRYRVECFYEESRRRMAVAKVTFDYMGSGCVVDIYRARGTKLFKSHTFCNDNSTGDAVKYVFDFFSGYFKFEAKMVIKKTTQSDSTTTPEKPAKAKREFLVFKQVNGEWSWNAYSPANKKITFHGESHPKKSGAVAAINREHKALGIPGTPVIKYKD